MQTEKTSIRERFAAQSSFSPKELAELDRKGLIFTVQSGAKESYPYAIAVEPLKAAWHAVDAWRINAKGEKDPEVMAAPAPVVVSELVDLDISAPVARRELQAFMRQSPFTYVFRLSGSETGSQVVALGVGSNEATAMSDAARRLQKRDPLEVRSPGEIRDLYQQLVAGEARVTVRVSGSYPGQDILGDYMSLETSVVAQVLSSDAEHCARAEEIDGPDRDRLIAEAFKAVAERSLEKDLDIRLVNWNEVSRSLPDAAVQDRANEVRLEQPTGAFRVELVEPKVDGRKIDQDVLDVLKRCWAKDNTVVLPPERLDPKLYKRVDEVLRALGGKWVGRKVQAHVFEIDPAAVLEVAVQTGTYVKPQDFGYFPTPKPLVDRVLSMVDLRPGMRVLEPQAGRGAFAIPIAEIVGIENVTVCELLPANLAKLREAGFTDVVAGDFLSVQPSPVYDLIAMNPPFSGGADIAHVMHAARFLKPDGQLIAITSPTWTSINNAKSQAFRDFMEEVEGGLYEVEAGAFKESGTNVATRIVTMDASRFPWNRESQEAARPRARGG